MKVYLNRISISPNQQKKYNVVTNPDNIKYNESSGLLLVAYNDHQIMFGAKQTVTAKLNSDKTRMIKSLTEILSTNVPELSAEEKAFQMMRKAMSFAKNVKEQIAYLKFQAEVIAQNTHLSVKQRYDELGKIDKQIKRLEKAKLPKEDPPKKLYENIDFTLINSFKTALSNDDFDLQAIFLNHYRDLESMKTVEEVREKYPHIKIPTDPMDIVAQKCVEILDRSFYERLDDEFEKDHSYEEIVEFLALNLLDTINYVIKEIQITNNDRVKVLINKVCEKALLAYENIRFKAGFSSVPEFRKRKEPDITLTDTVLMHFDYNDYVLKVLRAQYLEGKKLNEIEYGNNRARLLASEPKEPEYKFDKVSEKVKKYIADAQKLSLAQRDYKNFTNRELTERLNYYANSELGNVDAIFDIIVDFDSCQKTPEDMRYLVKFLKELDVISDNNLGVEDAVKLIKEKDLRPHGTYKINQIERQKLEAKRKLEQQQTLQLNQYRRDFDNAVNALYCSGLEGVSELCLKYYPESLDEKVIAESKKIIEIINKNISQKRTLQQLETEILQWEMYNEHVDTKSALYSEALKYSEKFDEIERESKIGQYLWNADIVNNYPKNKNLFINPELLSQIMERFGEDKNLATEVLCKYEDYKILTLKEKTSIKKILELFDNKDSNSKFILKSIIENEYVLSDTVVEPKSIIKTAPRTFASSAKIQILEKYRFPLCIEFFKAFEEALPLDAKALGSSGVKKTGRNNDSIEHKVELKISGHNDRLFSSQNNYYFDIFSDVGLH
ncbi:hypothetical protein IJD34_01505 [bacterium]|nr:hypothetical protein [bacterium]